LGFWQILGSDVFVEAGKDDTDNFTAVFNAPSNSQMAVGAVVA
jgi:hypothetical protein